MGSVRKQERNMNETAHKNTTADKYRSLPQALIRNSFVIRRHAISLDKTKYIKAFKAIH